MSNKDVFEILGINSREDSYTDLVKYAFDNSEEFKSNFCKFFAGYESSDFVLSVRNEHTYIVLSEKKKEVPDMILYSKNSNEIILIENKIFSGEGYKQTFRYSKPDFTAIVKERLKLPNAVFNKFYFVTLDGKSASCDKFVPILWSNMIEACTENVVFADPRLSILMNDLQSKSRHYADFKSPDIDTRYTDYFNTCTKWVDKHRAFECFFTEITKKLQKDYSFNIEFSSANNANGEQLLIVFYNPVWIGAEINQENVAALAFEDETYRNIHIELNWTSTLKRLSLFVHYETNPYKTQKVLREIEDTYGKDAVEQFREHRERFENELYKHKPEGWQKIGRELAIIKTDLPLNSDTTYQEIENWLAKGVRIAYDCITETLSAMH